MIARRWSLLLIGLLVAAAGSSGSAAAASQQWEMIGRAREATDQAKLDLKQVGADAAADLFIKGVDTDIATFSGWLQRGDSRATAAGARAILSSAEQAAGDARSKWGAKVSDPDRSPGYSAWWLPFAFVAGMVATVLFQKWAAPKRLPQDEGRTDASLPPPPPSTPTPTPTGIDAQTFADELFEHLRNEASAKIADIRQIGRNAEIAAGAKALIALQGRQIDKLVRMVEGLLAQAGRKSSEAGSDEDESSDRPLSQGESGTEGESVKAPPTDEGEPDIAGITNSAPAKIELPRADQLDLEGGRGGPPSYNTLLGPIEGESDASIMAPTALERPLPPPPLLYYRDQQRLEARREPVPLTQLHENAVRLLSHIVPTENWRVQIGDIGLFRDPRALLYGVFEAISRNVASSSDYGPIDWDAHRDALDELLDQSAMRDARLIMPAVDETLDNDLMNDRSTRTSGPRFRVRKLISPGLATDDRIIRANISS